MSNVIDLRKRRFLRGQLKHEIHPRLPWIIDEESFINGCNQCYDCLDVCETDIIKRDSEGFVFVDFDENECTFCGKCFDVCQKPLFKAQTKAYFQSSTTAIEKPWPGKFTINQQCLAKNDIYCQSCRDVCPSKAITFSYLDHKNKADGEQLYSVIPRPQLNEDNCNQCGACVSVCPQDAISFEQAHINLSGEHHDK